MTTFLAMALALSLVGLIGSLAARRRGMGPARLATVTVPVRAARARRRRR